MYTSSNKAYCKHGTILSIGGYFTAGDIMRTSSAYSRLFGLIVISTLPTIIKQVADTRNGKPCNIPSKSKLNANA